MDSQSLSTGLLILSLALIALVIIMRREIDPYLLCMEVIILMSFVLHRIDEISDVQIITPLLNNLVMGLLLFAVALSLLRARRLTRLLHEQQNTIEKQLEWIDRMNRVEALETLRAADRDGDRWEYLPPPLCVEDYKPRYDPAPLSDDLKTVYALK